MLISHTTIVFARYLVKEWERRCEQDSRFLVGLFFVISDEAICLVHTVDNILEIRFFHVNVFHFTELPQDTECIHGTQFLAIAFHG